MKIFQTLLLVGVFIFIVVSLHGEQIASRYSEPYPQAASKKGLQVELLDDAIKLGVKHAALNINLSNLVDPAADPDNPHWTYQGKLYHFNRRYLATLDSQIRGLSENHVLVNLILLAYKSNDPLINQLMWHPLAEPNAPNRLAAFNTCTPEGKAWWIATLEFIAERWSKPNRKQGRVVGYIIGNEVNTHGWWYNRGRVDMKEFTDEYLETVRLAHHAIRRQSSWARTYLSLDHHWTIRFAAGDEQQAFPAREFIDYFAKRAKEEGDFDWHLAYHPYPENLRNPRFWNDASAGPTADAARITFKNIDVLQDYFERDALLYNGKRRRIILSEQGFHSPNTPEGETLQAAAFCLAYKKVESLSGIDAFILHRHVDHPREGGLRLGLRTWEKGKPKKQIYACFQAADTPNWQKTFEFALPIVGMKTWEE